MPTVWLDSERGPLSVFLSLIGDRLLVPCDCFDVDGPDVKPNVYDWFRKHVITSCSHYRRIIMREKLGNTSSGDRSRRRQRRAYIYACTLVI